MTLQGSKLDKEKSNDREEADPYRAASFYFLSCWNAHFSEESIQLFIPIGYPVKNETKKIE